MKNLMIIGLLLLTGCAGATNMDVGKSENSKLVKFCIDVCSQVLEEMNQGDQYYMDACDTFARARTPEKKNTTIRLLTQAKQYYSTAEQTLRKMPLQKNEQIDEIYSLLLQAIGENIDSVGIVHNTIDQMIRHTWYPDGGGREAIDKKQSADAKIIKACDKIRELMGDKEEHEEQYFPQNIVEYIDTVKKRVDPGKTE